MRRRKKCSPQLWLTLTSRSEIETKSVILAEYGQIKEPQGIKKTIQRVWNLENEESLSGFAVA